MSVQEMVAEGDKVAVLWTFQGTHTGSGYEGLPATGTKVEVRGITIWRIVDGRIVDGGLPRNVCPPEMVAGVCGVGRAGHGDHSRTACLEDGQETVRLGVNAWRVRKSQNPHANPAHGAPGTRHSFAVREFLYLPRLRLDFRSAFVFLDSAKCSAYFCSKIPVT